MQGLTRVVYGCATRHASQPAENYEAFEDERETKMKAIAGFGTLIVLGSALALLGACGGQRDSSSETSSGSTAEGLACDGVAPTGDATLTVAPPASAGLNSS